MSRDRRVAAEALLRGGRTVVFPWYQNATEPSGEPHVFGTEPAIADDADANWLGEALLAALDEAAGQLEPPADPAKPFNKARTKAFGVTSLKALRDGLSTVSVRRTGTSIDLTAFAGSGAPGSETILEDPSAEELGEAVLALAATVS